MNKRIVEENIGHAYDFLEHSEIVNNKNEIDRVYRGYISTFGASVTTGNLLSAIAFFSQKGQGDGDRSVLMECIFDLVKKNHENVREHDLFEYVREKCTDAENTAKIKEEILDYAIAIKIAMNLFVMVEKNTKQKNKGEKV